MRWNSPAAVVQRAEMEAEAMRLMGQLLQKLSQRDIAGEGEMDRARAREWRCPVVLKFGGFMEFISQQFVSEGKIRLFRALYSTASSVHLSCRTSCGVVYHGKCPFLSYFNIFLSQVLAGLSMSGPGVC